MPRAVFTNRARTTLSAGINNSVTSIAVVDGSVFPTPTDNNYAYLTIQEGLTSEIVQLTARSGDTLTVVRARDGTAASTFTAAATVSLRLPRIVLDEIWEAIDDNTVYVNVRAYGALGDGTTDDTAAFTAAGAAAAAAKAALYVPGGTYQLSNWVPDQNLRVKGAGSSNTVLRRIANAPSNFPVITVSNSRLTLEDLTVNGNKANNTLGSQTISVIGGSNHTFRNLVINNAKAVGGGYGGGIVFAGTTDELSLTQSVVQNCVLALNDAQGVLIASGWNIVVRDNRVTSNGNAGIVVSGDPSLANSIRNIMISGNFCSGNTGSGIEVLGVNPNNVLLPPGEQVAYDMIIQGNICNNNSNYGIACQGTGINCSGNTCFANGVAESFVAGILFNCYFSVCADNICVSNALFGIDAGGAYECIVDNNVCSFNGGTTLNPTGIGINLGAAVNTSCDNNVVINNGSAGAGTGIQIYAPGYDYGGIDGAMPFSTTNISICDNVITCTLSTQVGIEIRQGGDGFTIQNNLIRGAAINNAIQLATSDILCSGNSGGGDGGVSVASAATMVVPDWPDSVFVTGTTAITGGIRTYSENLYFQKVAWVDITNGGSGYTSSPTVTISGGGGSGASALAYVDSAGKVAAILVNNYGSGYTSTPTVSFSGGGGSGAAATAQVGVPNRKGRTMVLTFVDTCRLDHAGGVFLQDAFSFYPVAGDTLTLKGQYGTNWTEVARTTGSNAAYDLQATAANIASAASTVNTRNKRTGRAVFDITNNRLMVSSGYNATDLWYIADGSGSITPS